jgi:ParB/RepB/Spo0J family partition protein
MCYRKEQEMKKKNQPPAASNQPPGEASFAYIPLSQLVSNTYNARRFDDMTPQRLARFDELTASIREKGVIEPLLVRPLDGDRFEVVAGERRFRAACAVVNADESKRVALEGLPCMVRVLTDDEAFDFMLIENLQREDLTPFEIAQAFSDYLKRHGDTHDAATDLALRTGLPVYAIRRQVRILRLPTEVVSAWKAGTITQSHAELFTRVGDEAQALELLTLTIRLKLSTRELAERIGAVSPELDKGFFDKTECQSCHFNSSVQSGLFSDCAQAGNCGNPSCFEGKQGAFLTANWLQSKAAEKYRTLGFCFNHRLPPEHYQPSGSQETAERCLSCDTFISVVRTTGAVVGMYERTCIGPRACFDELYNPPAKEPLATCIGCGCDDDHACEGGCTWLRVDRQSGKGVCSSCPDHVEQWDNPTPGSAPAKSEPSDKSDKSEKPKTSPPPQAPKKQTPPPPPPQETGPVYNGPRGERFRELFYKTALPETIGKTLPDSPLSLRLTLLTLALASPAARKSVEAALGLDRHLTSDQLAAKVFEVPPQDVPAMIQNGAVAHLLDSTVIHAARRIVADAFAIDLAKEWPLSREYLDALTVSELVRVGEEDGVGIWDDDKVRAARKEKFKGKALRSLKKTELLDLAINSGADLVGRVPAEVLGQRKG